MSGSQNPIDALAAFKTEAQTEGTTPTLPPQGIITITAGQVAPYTITPPPCEANLGAYYKFNEASGSFVVDSGPNGNLGTINDLAHVTRVTGRWGGALHFDGAATAFVNAGTKASVYPAQPPVDGAGFTLAAWVRPDPSNAVGTIFGSLAAGTGSLEVRVTAATVQLAAQAQALYGSVPVVIPSDGIVWTHVAITCVYGNPEPCSVYVNGVLAGSFALNRQWFTATSAVTIGGGSGGSEPFIGAIDDLRFYQVALPASVVSALAAWVPGP